MVKRKCLSDSKATTFTTILINEVKHKCLSNTDRWSVEDAMVFSSRPKQCMNVSLFLRAFSYLRRRSEMEANFAEAIFF